MKRKIASAFFLALFAVFGVLLSAQRAIASTDLDQAVAGYNKGEGTYQERLATYEKIAGMLKSEIQADIGTLNQGIANLTASGDLAADDPLIKTLNEDLTKDLNALYASYKGESIEVIDGLSSQKKIDFYNDFVKLYNKFLQNGLTSKHDQLVAYAEAVKGVNTAAYPFQDNKSQQYLNQWDTPLFDTKDIPDLPSAISPIALTPPTKENKMTIHVLKKWQDNNDQNRPKEIVVELTLPDKETPIATLTLTQKNEWKGSFKNLPVNDKYQVKEKKVSGYDVSYSDLEKVDDQNYHLTITNTAVTPPTPEKPKMQIDVIKEWQNTQGKKLPKDITVKLSLPGETKHAADNEVATIQLSAKNQWKASFKDLASDDRYKIEEVAVEGYTTTYSKLEKIAENHYQIKITNTLTPITPNKPNKPSQPHSPGQDHHSGSIRQTYPKTGEQKTSLWVISSGIALILLALYIWKKVRNKH